jgi:HEAT repeat protein
VWTPKSGTESLVKQLGSDAAFVLLTRLLLGEVNPSELTHSPFRETLHFIGNDHAKLILKEPIKPTHLFWTRSWAARSLAYLGDKDAKAWLIAALEDAHWRVRMTAAQTLGRLLCEGIEGNLISLLDDEHIRVRDAAALALGRIETLTV